MIKRAEVAGELFKEGYNCSQSVFAAFSDLYGIDQDTALKLSASFGGGVGRMREICGAVSGMCMVAGLETGSSKKMDDEGKKYNYDIVQKLSGEFKDLSGSLICRVLLGLDKEDNTDTVPQKRTQAYYNTRPCEQLVKDAADIIERVLYAITFVPVMTKDRIGEVSEIAEEIWHEHYDAMIGKEQVDYMIDRFQSIEAMKDQIESGGYHYIKIVNCGGVAGYLAYCTEEDKLFLSKIYIAKKYRGRDYSRKAMEYLEQICSSNSLNKIWLTVNRNNETSIKIYESLGFIQTGKQIADIGSGFVMDDYVMEKYIG
jgi:C_GCAxxG_C_C family probable redox protein